MLCSTLLPTWNSVAFAAPIKGYCVLWLRTDRGINIRGNAWDIQPTHHVSQAKIGDVVLFDYGGKDKDHAALILALEQEYDYGGIYGSQYALLTENWEGKVRVRKISLLAPEVKGIYRPLSTPVPFMQYIYE